MTFINLKVRAGRAIVARSAAREFVKYATTYYKEQENKMKTPRGKNNAKVKAAPVMKFIANTRPAELINIFEVSNINTTLIYLKSNGFWVSGFDSHSKKDFTGHDWSGRNVLLFGSEGYGLKYQTKKNSDFLYKIDINKNVESLNVSNSASIVFHHLYQLKKKGK